MNGRAARRIRRDAGWQKEKHYKSRWDGLTYHLTICTDTWYRRYKRLKKAWHRSHRDYIVEKGVQQLSDMQARRVKNG